MSMLNLSVNQLVSAVAAEKLAALMAEEHLGKRARRGSRKKFERVLRKVGSARPVKGDEL